MIINIQIHIDPNTGAVSVSGGASGVAPSPAQGNETAPTVIASVAGTPPAHEPEASAGVQEPAAPALPTSAPSVDANVLRKALYDATSRVGKERSIAEIKISTEGAYESIRGMPEDRFPKLLADLNALQAE